MDDPLYSANTYFQIFIVKPKIGDQFDQQTLIHKILLTKIPCKTWGIAIKTEEKHDCDANIENQPIVQSLYDYVYTSSAIYLRMW